MYPRSGMRHRSSYRPAPRSPPPGFGKFFPRDAPRSRKAPSKESGEAAGKEAGEAGEASKEAGEAGEAGKAGKEAGEGQRGGPKEAGKAESEPSFSDEAKEAWRGLFGGAGKPGARGGKPGGPKGGPKGDPKGGAGGQPPTPRMEDIIAAAALVLLTGFFLPMGGEAATVREISWQEFKTNLLQAGEVRGRRRGLGGVHPFPPLPQACTRASSCGRDARPPHPPPTPQVERIVVENKQVARVILRKPGARYGGSGSRAAAVVTAP